MSQPAEDQPDQALRRLAKEIRVWREEALRRPDGLDDLTLAAYVSGELDEAARREVEENLAACPELEEVVGVVRQTLERGDWQAKPDEIRLHLRPPVLVTPEPWAVHTPRARRRILLRAWLGAGLAAAAAVLLVLPVWRSGGPAGPSPGEFHVAKGRRSNAQELVRKGIAPITAAPAAALDAPTLRVYACSLDPAGRVAGREALAAGRTLRPGTHFQVEVAPQQAGLCLLQVGSGGKVKLLHSLPKPARAAERQAVLPGPRQAYRADESAGVASLVLVRTDEPGELVAKAQTTVDEILLAGMLHRGAARLSAAKPAGAMPVRHAASQPEAVRAPSKPPPTRPGLTEAQVRELLNRLGKDYDVKASQILQQKPE